MAAYNRPPSAPNLSPSLLQGYWSRPEGRGRSAADLNAQMPAFSSWEQAIAGLSSNPLYQTLAAGRDNDAYRTMFLQEAYGLPQNFGVRNGRIVSTDHSLRNGLLGGVGMIGGLSVLDALIGAPAAAALGPSTAGNIAATTAASAPPSILAAAGPTAAATTTAGVGSQILNSLRGRDGAAALMSLLPLLAARGGVGGNSGLGNLDTSRLNGLLDMTTERAKRTDPLHQSVTQLAMSRLPTGVQR